MVAVLNQRMNAGLDLDGVHSLRAARANTFNWDETRALGALSDPGQLLHTSLVITDSSGRRVGELPITFDRRVQTDSIRSIHGSDRTQSLRITLDVPLGADQFGLRFTVEPKAGAAPSELLQVLNWLSCAKPGRNLGLWLADRQTWATVPQLLPTGLPEVDPDYTAAVRVLARIESRSGTSFGMPAEITEQDAKQISLADRLLRGETIRGSWQSVVVDDVGGELADILSTSPQGVLLEINAEYGLDIDGTDVPLGLAEYRFPQAHASSATDDGGFELTPGSNRSVEIKLLSVPARTREDGATDWIPAAALKGYEGRWIAQSGTTIIDARSSFSEVASAIRGSGRLATIRHIPATPVDAEATWGLGL